MGPGGDRGIGREGPGRHPTHSTIYGIPAYSSQVPRFEPQQPGSQARTAKVWGQAGTSFPSQGLRHLLVPLKRYRYRSTSANQLGALAWPSFSRLGPSCKSGVTVTISPPQVQVFLAAQAQHATPPALAHPRSPTTGLSRQSLPSACVSPSLRPFVSVPCDNLVTAQPQSRSFVMLRPPTRYIPKHVSPGPWYLNRSLLLGTPSPFVMARSRPIVTSLLPLLSLHCVPTALSDQSRGQFQDSLPAVLPGVDVA